MPNSTRGVYPNWVSDSDIINQVLNDIIQQGGRLPYSFVVNEQQTQEQQERMKNIIQLML